MDAMNIMSNVEFLLIERMTKESMKEMRSEADTSRRVRDAGLARPGLMERASVMFQITCARFNQGLRRKSIRVQATTGSKYAH